MSFAANCPPSRRCSSARNRREAGWALISVLWALTVLALLAAATQALTSTSYRSERHALVDARADADLDAAVVRAVLGISDTRPEQRLRVDGTPRVIDYDGLRITVAAQDELGRIDLNASSSSLLRQLLLGFGVSPDGASKLSDRIVDWRMPPGPSSLNGGTDGDYKSAGLDYVPRHGPFQTVDELRLVLGMTPKLFDAIRPALTVYSKRPSFDPSFAPRAALIAIYPADPGKIDQILNSRASAPPMSAASAGHAYTVSAALTIGQRTFRRMAVVELSDDDRRPYFVLAWQ
jgi:general secretion pathway protein K